MTNEPLNNNYIENNEEITDDCLYYALSLSGVFCALAAYITVFYT